MNKSIYIVILLSLVSSLSHSQNKFSSDFKRETNLGDNNIFSSAVFFEKLKYSEIEFSYKNENGNFHRVQSPERLNSLGFNADGSYITDRLYMIGGFSFAQKYKNGLRFTSMLDPYRGTPYDIADSTYSDWKVQEYTLNGALAYEIIDNSLSFGLEATIDVARGAKQIDPRPKTNNNSISFSPSLSYFIKGHSINFGGTYKLFKENVDLILYNTIEPQKIYLLKGLGQYTYDIFSNTQRERYYTGNGFNLMGSYGYHNNRFSLLLEAIYENYAEDAQDKENSKLRTRGRFYSDNISFNLRTQYQSENCLNSINISYNDKNYFGREIIQVFDPSEEVNDWVTDSEIPQRWIQKAQNINAIYDFYLTPESKEYASLNIRAYFDYSKHEESYKVMDTYRSYNSYNFGLRPKYSFDHKKFLASVELDANYYIVKDFENNYTEREEDDHIIKDLFFDFDSNILAQNYLSMGGKLGGGYNLKKGSLWLSFGYKLLKSKNHDRNLYNVSFSYNF